MAIPLTGTLADSAETASTIPRTLASPGWPLYAVLASSVSIVIGLIWDISWHRTIGRDTFWSPPHLLEQAGAIVAGLSCGYLVLRTTFAGSRESRDMSVRYWKYFQGPVGAWVCIWGALMMITSAPFDDWWHNAYGLDVKIISPPHMVLASGMIAIQLGAMLMALAAQNRAGEQGEKKRPGILFMIAAASIILMLVTVIMEYASYPNGMHSSLFYKVTAIVVPGFLIAFARASRLSWPATRIALGYMAVSILAMWILQLVPATPRLAPIYNAVTHMVPPSFPLLLVVPALVIDVLLDRFGTGRDWLLSVLLGGGFVLAMVVAHWPWAEFMMSPNARNFIFGADQWGYGSRLGDWRYQYWGLDNGPTGAWSPLLFAQGVGIAALIAVVTSRLGLAWGKGMSRVRR